MADWLDYLSSEVQRQRTGPRLPKYRPPSFRVNRQGGGGYDPFEVGRSSSLPGAVRPPSAPSTAYAAASPPERFDFSMPFSTPAGVQPPKVEAPKSTEGDIFGSFGAALGDVASNVNIANAIPWLMERVHKAAGDFAKSNEGSPVGGVAGAAEEATGQFLGAIQSASDVVAPVIDAIPNWFRDNHLKNRAKLYQALITGQDPDFGPLDLGAWEATLPFTSNTGSELMEYKRWRAILEKSMDPDERMDAQTRLAILRDSIDLPEAVKASIRGNPSSATDDDFSKLVSESLDANGLPRAWSYDPGIGGMYANAAYPLAFYAGEYVVGGAALGGLKTGLAGGVARERVASAFGEVPSLVARPRPGLAQVIGGARGAAIERTVNLAAKGGYMAAKVQAASVAAGAGLTGITTTLDAIARYAGNEEAVAWFERLNEPTDFSESPNVQLVTGFSVNPFQAIGMLRKGTMRLGGGVNVLVGKATGGKLARIYDDEAILYGVVAKMYRLPSWQDAKAFAHGANARNVPYYADKGQVYEQALESAADYVLDRLPKQERVVLNATFKGDQAGLQRQVMATYGDQIEDAIRNHSDEVAQRFYAHSWQYHGYNDAFDPDVAAQNALDMRRAKGRSQEFRDSQGAIVGYNDFLAPEGATLARQFADQWAVGGELRRGGTESLDDLIRMFPALRKYWKGLVDPKSRTISRSAVDDLIVRAERDYADAAKQNPVRARTGAEPVLRPDSPNLDRDYAEALGTDIETVKAVSGFSETKPNPAATEKLRTLLAEKLGMDPADVATMAPEDVWARASEYVEETTAPWRQAGDRIVAAEKELGRLRAELRRLHALADPSRRSAENVSRLAELDQEIGGLTRTEKALAKSNRKQPTRAGLEQAAALREKITTLKSERTSIRRVSEGHRTMAHAEAMAAVERQIQTLQTLVREASDPIRPFSEDIRIERTRARNAERVKAMDPAKLTPADEAFLRRYVAGDPTTVVPERISAGDLLDRARDMADEAVPLARRDAALAERAARKVQAQQALDDVALIDDAAIAMGAEPGWLSNLRKVEGNWTWKGGGPAMPDGIRSAIARWADKAGRGVIAREIRTMGDEEAWTVLTDHPEATESLTRTQRNAVTRARAEGAGRPTLDQHAERAIRDGQVRTTDEYLEKLTDFAEKREAIIDGALTERNLQRTAGMEVPSEYLDEAIANAGGMEWAAIYDADFAANVHPRNVSEVAKILDDPDLFPALRPIVNNDPILEAAAKAIAIEKGVTLEVLLRDRTYAPALKQLVPEGFEAPVPGVRSETGLDDLILADDGEAIASRSQQLMEAASQPREPIRTTVRAAKRARSAHPSGEWASRLSEWGADQSALVNPAILDDAANRVGADVLSVINSGAVGRPPRTVRGTLAVLKEIEHGGGVQMGLGSSVQAEAQRVANELLRDAVAGAKRSGYRPGVFGGGLDAAAMMADDLELAANLRMRDARDALARSLDREMIRPGMLPESQRANVAVGRLRGGTAESGGAVREAFPKGDPRRDLLGGVEITYDSTDPLGTLQYGFKRRPNDAVVLELSRVPGLAEDFAAGRFLPWEERVGVSQIRQAYNYVFGPAHNTAFAGGTRQRFMDRAAAQGIDPEVSEAIWKRWSDESIASRDVEIRVNPRTRIREHMEGDNPLYATVGNIPNRRMDKWAHEAVDEALNRRGASQSVDPAYKQMAHTIDYAALFREASSFTRRNLRDLPGEPLGKALANAYGMVAHNQAVTTMYYWFRFALDLRYHAMNFFEAQLLYLGRSGLRQGEIDEGLFGQTEGFLRNLDRDMVNNTGYAQSRSRFSWAYRSFLKEQPAALRGKIKGLQAEDPALMRQSLDELATADPELRGMIAAFGDTPEGWMRGLDSWHGKMLRTANETEAGVVIDEALAKVMADTPAMAEVYGKLAQVNKELWGDVRATFYGNAQRSRAERFLNSYLLFWPLSYQVKATKWLLRTMYDRAGGLPTNAAGAVMLDRVAQTHQQLLANDPEYGEWFEKHPTLVFVAQMLVPITPNSIGVSLNPGLRSLFFGRSKAVWDIGPIYTTRHVVPQLGEELGADLYPALRDIPGLAGLYRATTGRMEPQGPSYLQD